MIKSNGQAITAFSWNIREERVAAKIIDKSIIKYRETVIPLEIRCFFEIENFTFGDKIDVFLSYKGKEYESVIIFENHNNRSKLKLNSELHKLIFDNIYRNFNDTELLIEQIKLVFIKEDRDKYTIKVIKEI